jgi:hypothetical protein
VIPHTYPSHGVPRRRVLWHWKWGSRWGCQKEASSCIGPSLLSPSTGPVRLALVQPQAGLRRKPGRARSRATFCPHSDRAPDTVLAVSIDLDSKHPEPKPAHSRSTPNQPA